MNMITLYHIRSAKVIMSHSSFSALTLLVGSFDP